MGEAHNILIEEAISRLEKLGITKITREAKLGGLQRIDILGFDDSERIGVEAIVQVQPKWVAKKIKNYFPLLNKLIFIVPNTEASKLSSFSNIEVWLSDRVKMGRKITVTFNDDVWAMVEKFRAGFPDRGESIPSVAEAVNTLIRKGYEKVKGVEPRE